jgi:hypothetical protein
MYHVSIYICLSILTISVRDSGLIETGAVVLKEENKMSPFPSKHLLHFRSNIDTKQDNNYNTKRTIVRQFVIKEILPREPNLRDRKIKRSPQIYVIYCLSNTGTSYTKSQVFFLSIRSINPRRRASVEEAYKRLIVRDAINNNRPSIHLIVE